PTTRAAGTSPVWRPAPAYGARRPSSRGRGICALFHRQQFHVEHQCRVRRDDAAGAARAVAERRRDDERALAADLHGGDALVPTLDDLARADRKIERLVAIDRGVEFLALRAVLVEPAGVMHLDGLAALRRGASAYFHVDDLKAG